MTWMYTPYAGVLWATAVVSAFVVVLIARSPRTAGIRSLTLLMSVVALWALAAGFEAASMGLNYKIIWAKVQYLAVIIVPTLFLAFAYDYSLRKKRARMRNIALLVILPLIAVIVALTNNYHHLIWKTFSDDPGGSSTVLASFGIGYYILFGYNFLVILAGLALLINAWLKFPFLYRRQISIILAGAIFPLMGGILYSLGRMPFPGLGLLPVFFMATSVIVITGIFMNQLFDRVPISRDALIENMLDGVVVLDAWDHIAHVNTVAEKLVKTLTKKSTGQPVEKCLPFWEDIQNRYRDVQEIRTELLFREKPVCFLDIHISLFYDRHKNLAGRLIILRDTTERRRTETDLARNVEELKILNRISLLISGGLDMERTLRTLYEQCSRVAPCDVFYVALYNPSSSLVDIPIYFERGKSMAGVSRDIRDHPGLIGNVIKARKTLYLHDGIKQITRPVPVPDADTAPSINSYIGIPLTVRDQIMGVMSIQSHQVNAFTEDHLRLLERIAVQAAIAIENARLYAEEQRLAIIDELTGVYNYRGLLELGSREVERAHRFNRPLAAIFFDIDDFRKLNNTYSHTTGNVVLQAVVKRCQSVLRLVDVLTRFGGDEFVALLPETDQASAEAVARRLASELAAFPISTSFGFLTVTISIGVTVLTDKNSDLQTLIDSANRAERQAKQAQKKTTD